MARLDGIIEKLFKEGGDELVLETGSGAVLKRATGDLPVIRTALSTAQILGALGEIAPAELRGGFPPGTTHFPHRVALGVVLIRIDCRDDVVRVRITRQEPGASGSEAAPGDVPQRSPAPSAPQA